MKKLFFSAAIVAMLCAACTDGVDEAITTAKFDTFSATANTTRTNMGDNYSVLWNEGDLVTIFNMTTENLQYEAVNVEGTTTALKHKSGMRGAKTLSHNYAIYPYDANATLANDVLSTSIAAEQTYRADSDLHHAVMVAKSSNTSLGFSNATSLLRCHLNTIIRGTTLKSIKVVSTSNNIAGKVTINMANSPTAVVTDGVKEITLDCGNVELTEEYAIFNIALAANEFKAGELKYIYTVNIDGVEHTFEYPINKDVVFEVGAFRQTKFTFSESFNGDTSEALTYADVVAEILNAGQDVVLEKDLELTEPLAISGTATLNLNGKTITGNFSDKTNEAVINNSGILTLSGNGIIKNTANNGAATIKNSGTLVLSGVKIQGAPLADGGYSSYAVVSSGKLTIEDGTSISADRGCLKFSGAGETIINGGNFTNNDIGTRSLTSHVVDVEDGGSHKLTINGGTFEHLHSNTSGGVVICNRTTGTVYVNGGNFRGGNCYGNDNLSDYGYGGTFEVKGGTYSAKPAAKYIATNHKTVENNGKYIVMPETVTAATSASDVSSAIANGSEVMLLGDIVYNTAISNDALINLNGNTFEATGTINLSNNSDLTMVGGNYVVNSTYGHVDIRPSSAEGSVVTYEDVDFSFNKLNKTYGPSTNRLGSVVEVCATATDAHTVIKFKNCTFDNAQILFEGMSGKTGTFEAIFEGCTFNALTSSAPIYVQNYVKGSIKLTNCTFNLECTSSTASAVSISPSTSTVVTVTAENNTINAVAATPYTYDASKGETEEYNIKVNGAPANIKFISISGTTSSATETGTIKTGIAL